MIFKINKHKKIIDKINSLEMEVQELSHEQIVKKTNKLRRYKK